MNNFTNHLILSLSSIIVLIIYENEVYCQNNQSEQDYAIIISQNSQNENDSSKIVVKRIQTEKSKSYNPFLMGLGLGCIGAYIMPMEGSIVDNVLGFAGGFSIGYLISRPLSKKLKVDTLYKAEKIYDKKRLGYKDPYTAFFLALGPGFIVHGIGHHYAGRKKTSNVLFITSVLSLVGMTGLALGGGIGVNPPESDIVFFKECLFIFLGTWIYDMVASPIVCSRDNKKLLQNISLNPYLKNSDLGKQIGVKLCYRF